MMFAVFRAGWRLLSVMMWLLWGSLLALFFIKVDGQQAYSPRQRSLIRWWMRGLLSAMGITLTHNKVSQASIWVANHVSWVDIIALMAIEPSRFLSKAEVAHWPMIGWLARRAGTVFMTRGGHQAQAVSTQLSELLGLGDRVVFFPEGTSQGGQPLKFHARLFALPIAEQRSVAPIALVYHDNLRSLRADLSYEGSQSFMANMWHLLMQSNISIQVSFMTDIASDGLSRNDLADACQGAVTCGWLQKVEPERCYP